MFYLCVYQALNRTPTGAAEAPLFCWIGEMVKKVRKVHNKVAGEFGELSFMRKAASLGLVVMKPLGDSMPYDVVVDNTSCLRRVQVKSTSHRIGGGYSVATARLGGGKARLYSGSEIDFLVAYIVPEDVWYILPIRFLAHRQGIRLYPNTRNSRSRYDKYREAWHLLMPKFSPRRIFAQADTGIWDEIRTVEGPTLAPSEASGEGGSLFT